MPLVGHGVQLQVWHRITPERSCPIGLLREPSWSTPVQTADMLCAPHESFRPPNNCQPLKPGEPPRPFKPL